MCNTGLLARKSFLFQGPTASSLVKLHLSPGLLWPLPRGLLSLIWLPWIHSQANRYSDTSKTQIWLCPPLLKAHWNLPFALWIVYKTFAQMILQGMLTAQHFSPFIFFTSHHLLLFLLSVPHPNTMHHIPLGNSYLPFRSPKLALSDCSPTLCQALGFCWYSIL